MEDAYPFLPFYRELGISINKVDSSGEAQVNCFLPFHEDLHASCSINLNTGMWSCYACMAEVGKKGGAGNAYQASTILASYGWKEYQEALTKHGITADSISFSQTTKHMHEKHTLPKLEAVEGMHKSLFEPAKKDRLAFLIEQRGLTLETINRFKIGWSDSKKKFTIPITDPKGQVVNIRAYNPSPKKGEEHMKMMHWGRGLGSARFFPAWQFFENSDVPFLVITEGEWDACIGYQHGLRCITVTGGASSWPKGANRSFQDEPYVVFCYDIDKAGQGGAIGHINAQFRGMSEQIRVKNVVLPFTQEEISLGYKDISDWFVFCGHTQDEFLQLVAETDFHKFGAGKKMATPEDLNNDLPPLPKDTKVPDAVPLKFPPPTAGLINEDLIDELSEVVTGEGSTLADKVYELIIDEYMIGYSEDRQPFAVPKTGLRIVHFLDSKELRYILLKQFKDKYGKVLSEAPVIAALGAVSGKAMELSQTPIFLRYAEKLGSIYIDMCSETGEAILINEKGWSVVSKHPICFRRTPALSPMAMPLGTEGDIGLLIKYLNLSNSEDFHLLVTWLVGMFLNIPKPVLILTGEQGAAKTTTARMLIELVNPTIAPLLPPPANVSDWAFCATASPVFCIDNLSHIPDWLSDSLCRAITGEATVRRKLYTTKDIDIDRFRRGIILNGISLGNVRGDLIDRSIFVHLKGIDPDQRRTEEELWEAFNNDYPSMLGGLLELTAKSLALLPDIKLMHSPRMADFYKLALAIDKVTNWGTAHTMKAKAEVALQDAATGDEVIDAILSYMDRQGINCWKATCTQIAKAIQPVDGRPSQYFPKNTVALGRKLPRLKEMMRSIGLEWEVWRNMREQGYTFTLSGEKISGVTDTPESELPY